ncbi:flagellar biosynthesis repressor FlbT [Sphingosinicella terrae]|uniref:flagellar biosynthesis repressor FlbT n=1 Tax=Sphingosinicella terrae TaxID=2172047 RepID=UPI000E0D07F0|nr:flagellar biosynthesis repressor FlbT [Sphingosinicella terrae]
MLRIALRDGEKVVVNGAVLTAVGRTQLRVENQAAILRGREIMAPETATTPARALYFHTMMAYVDPTHGESHQDRIIKALQQVASMLAEPEARAACLSFASHAAKMDYYKALTDCRQLIQLETELLDGIGEAA